jgi:hypothetical protein
VVGEAGFELPVKQTDVASDDVSSASAPPPTDAQNASTTRNDANARSVDAGVDGREAIEAALASALETAASAGRFDVVAQLARELEARRTGKRAGMPPRETAKPERTVVEFRSRKVAK